MAAASIFAREATAEERLKSLGLELPPPPDPIANFANAVREGTLMFISGQGPVTRTGELMRGKVGIDTSVEEAYGHARLVCLNLLSVMQGELGSLARVRRIVKLFGMVNAGPEFDQHAAVINGCSDLLEQLFGQFGPHARSAIGVASLPNNITVEIEAVVAVEP